MGKPFDPELTKEELTQIFPNVDNIKIIKSGGEGTVFKCCINSSNKEVAIKIYSPNHLIQRTELEISKLKDIKSPYLAQIYNFDFINIRGNKCIYTVSEYIPGEDLRTLLKQGHKFTEEDVENVIKCIGKSIELLWDKQIVHCDIKPNNILKRNDLEYVLIDLGIAKHLDAETMTAQGMIMGTHGYLAPEHFSGRRNLTLKADFYSLGIVAYELLAEYHPFNFNQSLMFSSDVPLLSNDICSSEKLRSLISKMTNRLPYKRPLNYKSIIAYLKEE